MAHGQSDLSYSANSVNRWPLALAEAAFKAGWVPEAADESDKDDPAKLLEFFTGEKAVAVPKEGLDDIEKI